MLKPIPNDLIPKIDTLADIRKKQILNSETNVVFSGTAYYVAATGCDCNDGLTPDTPWLTLNKVHSFSFQPGDAVFFRRGDTFRGRFSARDGVTYSAYGNGPKPVICPSPFNGAEHGEWIPTDVPDVYRYSEKFLDDVGCLIFDGGESYANKATVDFSTMTNLTDCKPFASWRDLANDLDFYHDLGGPNVTGTEENSTLYLKSTEGNPSERFKSIEFNVHTNAIMMEGHNIRINNLCVRHAGNHGIGSLTIHGLTVDWCVFEWIGGSMQYYEDGHPVRFGNAVEIYGGCSDYIVENCYINQVYDAGITHQFSAGSTEDIIMKDIIYKGNLVENCIYSIEYFNGIADNDARRHMSHVRISDNILRYAGCGFGKQRPDHFVECHIKAWDHYNHADNMIYENNIFDRSTYCLLHISCYDEIDYMPIIRKNIFIQSADGLFAQLGLTPTKVTPYTDEVIENETAVDKDNVFYVI